MSLFNFEVPHAEAELMVRYEVGMFNQRKEASFLCTHSAGN
jgi:hypothetical protein